MRTRSTPWPSRWRTTVADDVGLVADHPDRPHPAGAAAEIGDGVEMTPGRGACGGTTPARASAAWARRVTLARRHYDPRPVMPLPNLFVIGAPKCGTTSLHRYLDQHPRISMSAVKEPKFFLTDGDAPAAPRPR